MEFCYVEQNRSAALMKFFSFFPIISAKYIQNERSRHIFLAAFSKIEVAGLITVSNIKLFTVNESFGSVITFLLLCGVAAFESRKWFSSAMKFRRSQRQRRRKTFHSHNGNEGMLLLLIAFNYFKVKY